MRIEDPNDEDEVERAVFAERHAGQLIRCLSTLIAKGLIVDWGTTRDTGAIWIRKRMGILKNDVNFIIYESGLVKRVNRDDISFDWSVDSDFQEFLKYLGGLDE